MRFQALTIELFRQPAFLLCVWSDWHIQVQGNEVLMTLALSHLRIIRLLLKSLRELRHLRLLGHVCLYLLYHIRGYPHLLRRILSLGTLATVGTRIFADNWLEKASVVFWSIPACWDTCDTWDRVQRAISFFEREYRLSMVMCTRRCRLWCR